MSDGKKTSAGVVSHVFAAVNAIGLLLTLVFSLHIRLKFIDVYTDLATDLPVLTKVLVQTPWIIWSLLTMLLLAILIAKEFIRKKWIPLLINGLFVVFGVVYWMVFTALLLMPLMTMVEHMR